MMASEKSVRTRMKMLYELPCSRSTGAWAVI